VPSSYSLDPEVAAFVALMEQLSPPSIALQSPSEVRQFLASFRQDDVEPVSAVVDECLPRDSGPAIPVRIYEPCREPSSTIVFYHGGGWVIGSIEDYDHFARKFAIATGARVVSVEYRLAPEHPFPAAVDDAWDAFTCLAEKYAPLFLAGDSAGGNLAAVVAQQASRVGAAESIAGQLLFYPAVAGDVDAPAFSQFVPPVLPREDIVAFYDHYLPEKSSRKDIRFAPAKAVSLAGLPPTLIVTAGADLLAAEAEEYAAALQEAGVETELCRQPGAVHGFLSLSPDLTVSVATMAAAKAFIDAHATQRQRN
jgi:acetyl esterase